MSTIEKSIGRRHVEEPERPADSAASSDVPAHPPTAAPVGGQHRAAPDVERVPVDLQRLRAVGVWPPAPMEREIRDQYRRIKKPLIDNARGRGASVVPHGNLILVTSSVAGEGKTFTSIHLALSIAQDPDLSVLLVDGDVIRRSASQIFRLEEHPGLIDLLADDRLSMEDVVLPTTLDSLSIMPAGRPHSLGSELIAGARMQAMTERLAALGAGQIVVFDSAPLLASPEAVSLAGLAGQIVVVVKAGGTKQDQVLAALDQLDPAKPINLVLNQSRQSHGEAYYGGYYGNYGESQ